MRQKGEKREENEGGNLTKNPYSKNYADEVHEYFLRLKPINTDTIRRNLKR